MTFVAALMVFLLLLLVARVLRWLAWIAVFFLLGGMLHAFPVWPHGLLLDPVRLLGVLLR